MSGFCIEVASVHSWIHNGLLIQRSIGFHKCPPSSSLSFRLAEEVSESESSLSALVPGADVAEVERVVVSDAGADDALRLAVLDGEAGVHARADLAVLALESNQMVKLANLMLFRGGGFESFVSGWFNFV